MTKLDKIVKDMIDHANNAGTEVKEKEEEKLAVGSMKKLKGWDLNEK